MFIDVPDEVLLVPMDATLIGQVIIDERKVTTITLKLSLKALLILSEPRIAALTPNICPKTTLFTKADMIAT